MEKISKLYRQANWFRPLFVTLENGDEVQLDSIIVYDENGIIVQNNYGYFDNDMEIEIKEEVKRKRKENYNQKENHCNDWQTGMVPVIFKQEYNQKENYVLRSKKDCSGDIIYKLYIYKNNVDLQFLGFEKTADLIMAKYSINGGEFKDLYKTISGNKYIYENRYRKLRNSIKEYSYPMDEEELNMICKELIEVNKKIIEEKKRIEDFKIESMEEEAQEIMNRLMGK